MFSALIHWLVDTISGFGYLGIVILMFLESSFFPFPSEIVMIPAGYLVAQGEMNLGLVVFMGILGSLFGALFNYYLALLLGKKILKKYQKWFFLNDQRFQKIEKYFTEHGHISTFIGRLLPGIRQYISFPAGLSQMNLFKFILFTSLGAGIWVLILTIIGYQVGYNQQLIQGYLNTYLFWIMMGVVILGASYMLWVRRKNKKAKLNLTLNI
jgi:membrane protein DedA with SNARE-associated domain